jgi:pleckstrin homology-like domain family B
LFFVLLHHFTGDLKIGSATDCGIMMNGTGVQPLHCTVYRNEVGDVTILPEPGARTLIDSNSITEETNLTQGAMLTIGKSNYLRFNNPAEAEFIKSTMGSNERISMPQIDFAQNSNGSPNSE